MVSIIIPPQDNPDMRKKWLRVAREMLHNAQLNCDPRQKEWQDMTDIIAMVETMMGII